MWARYYQLEDQAEQRDKLIVQAKKENSDGAKEFISKQKEESFAAHRELKVIVTTLKDKIPLDNVEKVVQRIAGYEAERGEINIEAKKPVGRDSTVKDLDPGRSTTEDL